MSIKLGPFDALLAASSVLDAAVLAASSALDAAVLAASSALDAAVAIEFFGAPLVICSSIIFAISFDPSSALVFKDSLTCFNIPLSF